MLNVGQPSSRFRGLRAQAAAPSSMIPSFTNPIEKNKQRTTFDVMPGSMTAENAQEIVGDTVRGFVDPRGSFDTSDR